MRGLELCALNSRSKALNPESYTPRANNPKTLHPRPLQPATQNLKLSTLNPLFEPLTMQSARGGGPKIGFKRGLGLYLGVPMTRTTYSLLWSILGLHCLWILKVLKPQPSKPSTYNTHASISTELLNPETPDPKGLRGWGFRVTDFGLKPYSQEERLQAQKEASGELSFGQRFR